MKDYPDFVVWLSDDEYQKLQSQTRMRIGEILFELRRYGQDPYVDGAIEEIMQIFDRFGMRVRGIDKPIDLKYIVNPRDY